MPSINYADVLTLEPTPYETLVAYFPPASNLLHHLLHLVLRPKGPHLSAALSVKKGLCSIQTLESPAERSFLGALDQTLDNKYRIFGKVRLGDLVKPAKGLSNSKRVGVRNKVNQKHVDFVVCTATDLAVVGVIELDDQSHEREDRTERDALVDHALSCAGIPIARFSVKKGYQIQELRIKLAEAFKLTMHVPAPTLANSQEPSPSRQTNRARHR
ncbi:DUF2726 domain-containing protein [Citrifermentans bremense]|uniref:DUF2726 domain-containing protein n=1 Tax=Citrifermentans bremense TaxID=60035 RepID=UPI00384A9F40